MLELFYQAISPLNILFTALLLVCVLYWLSVVIGALDISSLDVEFDFDADIDLDLDVDADVDAESDTSSAGFGAALYFFNFGKMPFMVVITVLIMSMWVISILANYYIGKGSIPMAALILLPNLAMSLFITKIITAPLIPVFKDFGQGKEAVRYVGNQCKILLPPTTTLVGTGEVRLDGNVLLVNIKLIEGGQTVVKGDMAAIVDEIKEKKIYLVDKV